MIILPSIVEKSFLIHPNVNAFNGDSRNLHMVCLNYHAAKEHLIYSHFLDSKPIEIEQTLLENDDIYYIVISLYLIANCLVSLREFF